MLKQQTQKTNGFETHTIWNFSVKYISKHRMGSPDQSLLHMLLIHKWMWGCRSQNNCFLMRIAQRGCRFEALACPHFRVNVSTVFPPALVLCEFRPPIPASSHSAETRTWGRLGPLNCPAVWVRVQLAPPCGAVIKWRLTRAGWKPENGWMEIAQQCFFYLNTGPVLL